jgi:hypothetical protein
MILMIIFYKFKLQVRDYDIVLKCIWNNHHLRNLDDIHLYYLWYGSKVDTTNTQIHDGAIFWLGIGTSIKSGGIQMYASNGIMANVNSCALTSMHHSTVNVNLVIDYRKTANLVVVRYFTMDAWRKTILYILFYLLPMFSVIKMPVDCRFSELALCKSN